MSKKLSLSEVCKLAGLTYGAFAEVIPSNTETAGFTLRSEAGNGDAGADRNLDRWTRLEKYADRLSDKAQADKIRAMADSARKAQQKRAERAKSKAEAERKAREDAQQRADDAIRQRIRRANPSATPEQIEALLPKAREAMMLKRTLELPDVPYDDGLRKF